MYAIRDFYQYSDKPILTSDIYQYYLQVSDSFNEMFSIFIGDKKALKESTCKISDAPIIRIVIGIGHYF